MYSELFGGARDLELLSLPLCTHYNNTELLIEVYIKLDLADCWTPPQVCYYCKELISVEG